MLSTPLSSQGAAELHSDFCELTILMPCLDEAETIRQCVDDARRFLERSGVHGEVLVADNGSRDGSPERALAAGARVVHVESRGYGNVLLGGIKAARGRYVVMGDSDGSYDFSNLGLFLDCLRAGSELVIGNRFKGGIEPGAMPFLHRYLGNPVLTRVGRMFFAIDCGDFHCGLRAFSRRAVLSLNLQAAGMEFASEMIVKAGLKKLRIAEVPTRLAPAGRSRPPHLKTWRDGWRHLRFLLLFSPRWLFLYPGLMLFLLGVASMIWLEPHSRFLGRVELDIHTLFYSSAAVMVGSNSILFWAFSKTFGVREGLLPPDKRFEALMGGLTLEVGLLVAVFFWILGGGLALLALSEWSYRAFGPMSPEATMRLAIPSITAILLGCQMACGAFFLSVLGLRGNLQTHMPGSSDNEHCD